MGVRLVLRLVAVRLQVSHDNGSLQRGAVLGDQLVGGLRMCSQRATARLHYSPRGQVACVAVGLNAAAHC